MITNTSPNSSRACPKTVAPRGSRFQLSIGLEQPEAAATAPRRVVRLGNCNAHSKTRGSKETPRVPAPASRGRVACQSRGKFVEKGGRHRDLGFRALLLLQRPNRKRSKDTHLQRPYQLSQASSVSVCQSSWGTRRGLVSACSGAEACRPAGCRYCPLGDKAHLRLARVEGKAELGLKHFAFTARWHNQTLLLLAPPPASQTPASGSLKSACQRYPRSLTATLTKLPKRPLTELTATLLVTPLGNQRNPQPLNGSQGNFLEAEAIWGPRSLQ